jgi:broad specificity phosphatase PhoE
MSELVYLYLARHGRTAWNAQGRFQGQSDVPLDEVGRAQASALAAALSGKVEAVLASDLLRARETGQIVADALQVPMLGVDPELRERGYGIFEGLNRDEIVARYPEAWASRGHDRNFVPPGGESNVEVLARMQRAIERAAAAVRGRHQHALIVGHGSALRMFLELLGGEARAPMANAEVHRIVYDGATFERAD